jgi:hypothetical protein
MPHDIKGWFAYSSVDHSSVNDFRYLVDGDPNTQYQVVSNAPFAAGTVVFQVDLKELKDVAAIDMTAGWFNPNSNNSIAPGESKLDLKNSFSIQYCADSGDSPVTWEYLHKDAYRFNLESGASISFDVEKLGYDFQARYLRVLVENQEVVQFMGGKYAVSIVHFAVWKDVILDAEAYLDTAYANPISSDLESRDNRRATLNDTDSLLTKYGERVYKDNEIKGYLNTNTLVRERAIDLLIEFVKNNTKAKIDIAYSPHLFVGQTVTLVDAKNNINRNYFIESIDNNNGNLSLQVAYYQ